MHLLDPRRPKIHNIPAFINAKNEALFECHLPVIKIDNYHRLYLSSAIPTIYNEYTIVVYYIEIEKLSNFIALFIESPEIFCQVIYSYDLSKLTPFSSKSTSQKRPSLEGIKLDDL